MSVIKNNKNYGTKVKITPTDPDLQDKSITANGTYTADQGYDGLGTVTVNVQASPENAIDIYYNLTTSYFNCDYVTTTSLDYGFYKLFGLSNYTTDDVVVAAYMDDDTTTNLRRSAENYQFKTEGIHKLRVIFNSNVTEIPADFFNVVNYNRIAYVDYKDFKGNTVMGHTAGHDSGIIVAAPNLPTVGRLGGQGIPVYIQKDTTNIPLTDGVYFGYTFISNANQNYATDKTGQILYESNGQNGYEYGRIITSGSGQVYIPRYVWKSTMGGLYIDPVLIDGGNTFKFEYMPEYGGWECYPIFNESLAYYDIPEGYYQEGAFTFLGEFPPVFRGGGTMEYSTVRVPYGSLNEYEGRFQQAFPNSQYITCEEMDSLEVYFDLDLLDSDGYMTFKYGTWAEHHYAVSFYYENGNDNWVYYDTCISDYVSEFRRHKNWFHNFGNCKWKAVFHAMNNNYGYGEAWLNWNGSDPLPKGITKAVLKLSNQYNQNLLVGRGCFSGMNDLVEVETNAADLENEFCDETPSLEKVTLTYQGVCTYGGELDMFRGTRDHAVDVYVYDASAYRQDQFWSDLETNGVIALHDIV